MAGADKPKVVTTRWWWVRHAPVRNDGGNIYGQSDLACDTSEDPALAGSLYRTDEPGRRAVTIATALDPDRTKAELLTRLAYAVGAPPG